MPLSLRRRMWLMLGPLLLLLAALGTAGVVLLSRLGGQASLILRENYDSVQAMFRLTEALERLDSSFQFALAGREAEARRQYADNWPRFNKQLDVEQNNVTLPGEQELADRLTYLAHDFRERGDQFFDRPAGAAERSTDYFGGDAGRGLLATFRELKSVSAEILRINQQKMEETSQTAKAMAERSRVGFGVGVAAAGLLAGLIARQLFRAVLGPIHGMTHAAEAIGAGQLHLSVPVHGTDELGQLAVAFNTMTRHLRDVRQTNTTRLLRAQQTGQATIDSFPDPILVVD